MRIDLAQQWADAVAAELDAIDLSPAPVVADDDLAQLPPPVARYIRETGACGRPRPRVMRLEFDAAMRRTPGGRPMTSTSVQYNLFDDPARLFLMRSRMLGLPVKALHLYRHEAATFRVRVGCVADVVNLSGPAISAAETVTVLNDLCLMAPGALVDPRLHWTPVDDRTASVRFRNGGHDVGATLEFDDDGLLRDFWSDDRPDASTGEFVPMRWRTPVRDYRETDAGVLVATRGEAVYERPDGPFAYGEFQLRSLRYDVSAPGATSAPGSP